MKTPNLEASTTNKNEVSVIDCFFCDFSGFDDPQTVFTFVVVTIAVLLLGLRVCFGMFKRFGPHKVNRIYSFEVD